MKCLCAMCMHVFRSFGVDGNGRPHGGVAMAWTILQYVSDPSCYRHKPDDSIDSLHLPATCCLLQLQNKPECRSVLIMIDGPKPPHLVQLVT